MVEEIVRYPMKKNTDRPLFEYLVKTNMEFEYWLFEDFDSALECAKTLHAKTDEMILIYDCYFDTRNRQYRAQKSFWIRHDGKVVFDKHGDIELHVEFYINAGEWMNPRQDWIDTIRRYENVHE